MSTKAKPPTAADLAAKIHERAKLLGLTANGISVKLGGNPTPETVGKLLRGESVRTVYLFRVLELLKWDGQFGWKDK